MSIMKIATVIGARPQFIKASALSLAIRARPDTQETIIHTGQHYDANMSRIFFEDQQIPKPKYELGVGSGSHAEQTAKILVGLEKIFSEERPDHVLVYGDTN